MKDPVKTNEQGKEDIYDNLKNRAHRVQLSIKDKEIEDGKKAHIADPLIAKPILDKYATKIACADQIRTVMVNGVEKDIIDDSESRMYNPKFYDISIPLWVAPLDCIRIEFEDTPKNNKRHIINAEIKLKSYKIDYCITGHKGKSDYINIFNVANIPTGDNNPLAKKVFLESILTKNAMKFLDVTNLSGTFSPVIGHSHWKRKYNATVHNIISGKNPLEHKNKLSNEVLKEVKKRRKNNDKKAKNRDETKKTDSWVEDFLLNYCCKKELPGGERHKVIEKNLACLIQNRRDKKEIIAEYVKTKGSAANVETWLPWVAINEYEISPGELANYIRRHNIPYVIVSESGTKDDKPKPLSGSEKQQAIETLQHPNLINNIVEGIKKQEGLVGEEDNVKAMLNKIMMRKVIGYSPTSSNLLVSDRSGGGKDALANAVTNFCVPKNELIKCTRLSPHVLEYWAEDDPEFTWRNKVLYLEDPPANLVNGDVFRVMLSGGSNVYVLRDQIKVDLKIPGKPVFIITSYQTALDYENVRRVDQMRVDVSIEQTNRIIDAKTKKSQCKKEKRTLFLSRALGMLENKEVIIPFGRHLHYHVKDQLKMRTKIGTMIDFIRSSAVLHQYQRKTDNDGALIAEPADYEYAAFVFNFLKVGGGAPVNVNEERILTILAEEGGSLSIHDIIPRHKLRGKTWIYKAKDKLKEKGLINEIYVFDELANKEILHLALTEENKRLEFPLDYNQLGSGKKLSGDDQPSKSKTNIAIKDPKKKVCEEKKPVEKPEVYNEKIVDEPGETKQPEINPKDYSLVVRDIEKQLSCDPIQIMPLCEKMKITIMEDMRKRQQIIDAAIKDPLFDTIIKRNENGYYIEKKKQ